MSLCCPTLVVGSVATAAASSSAAPLSRPSVCHTYRHAFISTLTSQTLILPRISPLTHAKRRPSVSAPPAQQDEQHYDEDFRESINQLSTDAVRAMLSDDMKRMEDLRDTIYDLEVYFEKEKEADALLFVLVIRDMLDHRILPEVKHLKGSYKKAFDKICSILEDSGWLLKGDENEFGVEMVDDELIPPTFLSEYR